MGVLPMFPLGSVLLPGELLPLQVFEPRYRQLVVDLLADDVNQPEFGVTLIERGHEVGGGDQRSSVGTLARVVAVDVLDDGRYAVVAAGRRRIRVRAWLPDDPYPVADVDEWPDRTDDPEALRLAVAAARPRVLAARRLAIEIGDAVDPTAGALGAPDERHGDPRDTDPIASTYDLAALAPLGPADRHRLLAAATPEERLDLLDAALDDVEAVLRFRAG